MLPLILGLASAVSSYDYLNPQHPAFKFLSDKVQEKVFTPLTKVDVAKYDLGAIAEFLEKNREQCQIGVSAAGVAAKQGIDDITEKIASQEKSFLPRNILDLTKNSVKELHSLYSEAIYAKLYTQLQMDDLIRDYMMQNENANLERERVSILRKVKDVIPENIVPLLQHQIDHNIGTSKHFLSALSELIAKHSADLEPEHAELVKSDRLPGLATKWFFMMRSEDRREMLRLIKHFMKGSDVSELHDNLRMLLKQSSVTNPINFLTFIINSAFICVPRSFTFDSISAADFASYGNNVALGGIIAQTGIQRYINDAWFQQFSSPLAFLATGSNTEYCTRAQYALNVKGFSTIPFLFNFLVSVSNYNQNTLNFTDSSSGTVESQLSDPFGLGAAPQLTLSLDGVARGKLNVAPKFIPLAVFGPPFGGNYWIKNVGRINSTDPSSEASYVAGGPPYWYKEPWFSGGASCASPLLTELTNGTIGGYFGGVFSLFRCPIVKLEYIKRQRFDIIEKSGFNTGGIKNVTQENCYLKTSNCYGYKDHCDTKISELVHKFDCECLKYSNGTKASESCNKTEMFNYDGESWS